MKYKIYAALSEDINNGWVWLPESVVSKRTVVKIKNIISKKAIYCEALPVGKNFINRYNKLDRIKISNQDPCLVANEWYREKLGIEETQTAVDLKISNKDNYWGHLMASLDHPQIVVRLATRTACLGLFLGVVGVLISLIQWCLSN